MSRGHGVIINLSSGLPFVFQFNPKEVSTSKQINYVIAPNIGGSHKKRYFSGFDTKEASFVLECIDMQNPLGVKNTVSYFEQLRTPDAGLFGIAASFGGNENYPPPQILLQFGVSFMPVVWDVLDIDIKVSHFHDGHVRGVVGIPKKADISIKLALVEDHPLNKANKIAEKVSYLTGSAESLALEGLHKQGRRKDAGWKKSGGNQPGNRVFVPKNTQY